MRVRLSARTVLAIAIVVSCGGGDGEGNGGTAFVDTGGYETPPPSFDRPPGQDPPPSDYDNPSGSPHCASLCQALVAEGCTDVAPDLVGCTQSCTQEVATERCANELLALLTCAVNAPEFSCDLFDEGETQGDFAECTPQARAYSGCEDDDGGEGGQGGI